MNRRSYRHWFGLTAGALMGLFYGLVSQLLNEALLPGVPLYHPPFGLPLNILAAVGVGSLMGGLTGWSENSIKGIFLGSLPGAACLFGAVLFGGESSDELLAQRLFSLFLISLPLIATIIPVTALFRWILNEQQDRRDMPWFTWVRLRGMLLLALLAVGAGAFSFAKPSARQFLPMAHQLIQQGLTADSPADLPPSFQPPDVTNFMERAEPRYTLQWTRENISRFGIGVLFSALGKESVVIARFENGWLLACLYWDAKVPPDCRGFDSMPPRR